MYMEKNFTITKIDKFPVKEKIKRKDINKTFYLCAIKYCPKCNKLEWGTLSVRYHKYINSKNWYGPYFSVLHYKKVYESTRWRKWKKMGLSTYEILGKKNLFKTKYLYDCYLGKNVRFSDNVDIINDRLKKIEARLRS